MPNGIMLGMFTLIALGFLVLIINPAIPIEREVTDAAGATATVHGAFALGTSGEPILDGFRAIFGSTWAKVLALIAVAGLIASFHAIIFAYGRQIYSLSRAGYFPHFLSVTHGEHKTPNIASDRRRSARPRGDAGRVVRHGRRGGGLLHRRRAAQHGRVRRHVLVSLARRSPSSSFAGTFPRLTAPIAARSAFLARR